MDREEVTKWLTIMKANLNSFPEVSNAKKIEALAEAIRLLKNEQSIDKIDCEHTECRNCTNHKYCDYETSSSENPNKSEIPTSSDCVDRHSVDLLVYRYLREPTDNHVAFYEDFLDLQSVTPIRPKGHWIKKGDRGFGYSDIVICKCSECGEQKEFVGKFDGRNNVIDAERADNYCSNCGADMRTSED